MFTGDTMKILFIPDIEQGLGTAKLNLLDTQETLLALGDDHRKSLQLLITPRKCLFGINVLSQWQSRNRDTTLVSS